jgi:hypothetical protein
MRVEGVSGSASRPYLSGSTSGAEPPPDVPVSSPVSVPVPVSDPNPVPVSVPISEAPAVLDCSALDLVVGIVLNLSFAVPRAATATAAG